MNWNKLKLAFISLLVWFCLNASVRSFITAVVVVALLLVWHPSSRFFACLYGAILALAASTGLSIFIPQSWGSALLWPNVTMISGGVSGWLMCTDRRKLPQSAMEFALVGYILVSIPFLSVGLLERYGLLAATSKAGRLDFYLRFLPYTVLWYAVPGIIAAFAIWFLPRRNRSLTTVALFLTPLVMTALAVPFSVVGPAGFGTPMFLAWTIKTLGLFPILWTGTMLALKHASTDSPAPAVGKHHSLRE